MQHSGGQMTEHAVKLNTELPDIALHVNYPSHPFSTGNTFTCQTGQTT